MRIVQRATNTVSIYFCNNHKLRCDTYPAFELFDELSALEVVPSQTNFPLNKGHEK